MKMTPSPADAGSDTSESVETADTAALTASSPAASVLTSSSSSSSSSSALTSSTSSDHSSELGTSDTDQHQTQSDRNHGSNSANNTAKEEYNNNNNNNNNSAVIPPGDTLEYVLVTDNLSEPNLVVLDKSNDEVVDNSGHSEANSGHSGDNSTVITLTTPPDRSSASVMHISQTR